MERTPSRFRPDPGSNLRIALAVGFGVIGVLIAHYPMIASGFQRLQTELGDSRFIHYLLEHGYRWALGEPAHRDFWSPPFFYPARNAAAYSDVMLSVGPVYWLWRALGASPDLSFGLWMVSMSAFNYAAGLLLFRRGLGFGTAAAVAGASLVAFGAPRLNQLGHQQLLPFFFPLLTLYALARLLDGVERGKRARVGDWFLAMAGIIAQLYAGVYLGWFLIVGLGTAAVAALAMPSCRGALITAIRRDVWVIAAVGAGGAVLLIPFLTHYLPTAREVGQQYLPILRRLHPRLSSWIDVGARNWFWGWSVHPGPVDDLNFLGGERLLGIGYVTSVACLVGLYLGWRWPICRLAAVTLFVLCLATTFVPGNQLVMLAAGVGCYCAGGLLYQVDRPGSRAIGLAAVLCLVLLVRSTNPYLIVFELATMILCLVEIGRTRGRVEDLIVPAIAVAVISIKLMTIEILLYGFLMVAPWAGIAAYFFGRRFEVGLASAVGLILFAMTVTFLDQPGVLIGSMAAAALALVVNAPVRLRPPPGMLLPVMLLAALSLVIFYDHDSLWLAYSWMIPGAPAMRAIGRVVLIMLVPAAVGLASLVEVLDRGRLAIAGWAVALFCLAEQGVTNETFDAAANRASIERLACRVDRAMVAFYYHPADGRPFYLHHLDAMWASLESRVPTINGYSGHAPREWHPFFYAEFDPNADTAKVLAEWERTHELASSQVEWIGAEAVEKPR